MTGALCAVCRDVLDHFAEALCCNVKHCGYRYTCTLHDLNIL